MTIALSHEGGFFAMYWEKSVLALVTLCVVSLAPSVAPAQEQPRFSIMGVVIRQDVSYCVDR